MKGINLVGEVHDEDLDVVRGAGFDLVRLPVRWADADRRAVDRTVEAALGRGFSVVLDVHHFSGSGPELIALWRELGVRFEGVTFELLNEPVDADVVERLAPAGARRGAAAAGHRRARDVEHRRTGCPSWCCRRRRT